MKHVTINNEFSTSHEAIEDVKLQLKNLGPINGRLPVVVKYQSTKTKTQYGIQYWTEHQIKDLVFVDTDKNTFTLCYSKY